MTVNFVCHAPLFGGTPQTEPRHRLRPREAVAWSRAVTDTRGSADGQEQVAYEEEEATGREDLKQAA